RLACVWSCLRLVCCLVLSSSPRPPPRSPLFPYTTLFRSKSGRLKLMTRNFVHFVSDTTILVQNGTSYYITHLNGDPVHDETYSLDRKSTRLNSSHVSISYAVFCLKKKKQQTSRGARTPAF